MRKAPLRLACPACLGVALESVSVAEGVTVRHCVRCGGAWIPRAQAPRLRALPTAAVQAALTRREDASFVCHNCHAVMDRDAHACAACLWSNTLECPDCGRPMRRETRDGLTVDVCRACSAAWLDHPDLRALWTVAAAGAIAGTTVGGRIATTAGDAGGFLLDTLWWAPDLAFGAVHASAHVAGAGIEALSHAPEMLAGLPDAAGGVAEAASDAAGGVFSLIADVIGGLFDF